jgi:RNA polymerase sigma-70 factor (ECF subfamily)
MVDLDENNDVFSESTTTPDVLSEIISRECYQNIVAFIEEMGDTYRDTMRLRFVFGYSNNEIVEILKITKDNVETRIGRGRAMLKAHLRKEGYYADK